MLPAFRKSISWADHIITISEYSRQQIMQHFSIPEEQISIVSNGVEEAWHEPLRKETLNTLKQQYNLPENYLINVGTLQPRKNVKNLIIAYKHLPKAIRNEIPLVIVGREGWDCQDVVKELTNSSGTHIRWLKYLPHSELMGLVKGAMGMVFPSLAEGFGLPVIEAFAGGTPVITSNTSSLPEVAGEAALLVEPEKPEAIAAAMQTLLEDSQLQEKLISLGKQRAQNFSWSKTAKNSLEVYQQVTI